jgi:hypothetical protein
MTTNEAHDLYDAFVATDGAMTQLTELAEQANLEELTDEQVEQAVANFVKLTFGTTHDVLLEQIASDVGYYMDHA